MPPRDLLGSQTAPSTFVDTNTVANYCRMNDYKTYIKVNVLRELQIKVLGEEGFRKWWKEQILDM
jgi:hypothetical protein